MFFPKREKLVIFYKHFIFQNSFRVSVNEQLISALRSFVHVRFVGSAHTQFIYFTLSKNCGFVHYQDGTWTLTTVFWTWLGFPPHVALFCVRKSNLLILVHITKETSKLIRLIRLYSVGLHIDLSKLRFIIQ